MVAERNLGQLERLPIERVREWVGDERLLNRCGGVDLILEVDRLRQQAVAADEMRYTRARRADFRVGIRRSAWLTGTRRSTVITIGRQAWIGRIRRRRMGRISVVIAILGQ